MDTKNKAKKNMDGINQTKRNFEHNVKPLVAKLAGLNGVADELLREAISKTTLIQNFEESVKLNMEAFFQY